MKKFNPVLKILRRMKRESQLDEYGWSDLEDDINEAIVEAKKMPCCGHDCCCNLGS